MPEYRCYFFGPDEPFSTDGRVHAAVEKFIVRTDDEARLKAHMIYRRRNQPYGFEVWQADMLVSRHPGVIPDAPATNGGRKSGNPIIERHGNDG